MIYIFELQNLVKNIYDIKEFKILFDLLTSKQKIENIESYKVLSELLIEINKFDYQSTQSFNGGILFKLTNTEWIYFKQKYDKNFVGYVCLKNIYYYFSIDIIIIIDLIKKQIPNISFEELENIKELIAMGNSISDICYNLKIKKDTVQIVNSIYHEEIFNRLKEKFTDLVIKNTNRKDIIKLLNLTNKNYQRLFRLCENDINKNTFQELIDYYPNEKIRLKCPFKNGLINGKVCIYDTNGKLFKEIDFIDGQINGHIKIYDNKRKDYSIKKVASSNKISNIPVIEDSNITEKYLYENALKLCWEVLEFIPDIYKTEENCMIAFEQNELALKYFPSKYRTKEICQQAVERNLLAFKDIPNKFKTKELSELFFEKYSKELKHIPNIYRTEDMCNKAFLANYDNFKHIPNEYKTFEMCKKAVRNNGELIAQVPKELLNEELCLLAVKQNGLSIKYIPDNYKQQNIIVEAVKQDYHAISLVTLQNENDLAVLIKNNKEVFKHLPPQVKNKHLCSIALHQDIENIRYIPTELIDEDMCLHFLRKIQKKKIVDKKQLINTIKNRLKILQIGIVEEKRQQNITSKFANTQFPSQQPESYDDIINNYKYKNQTDLITIENSHDKIFNLTLIKNNFEAIYTDFVGKISSINKNSSSLKIKTKYKNIYYVWSFRNNSLEIILEFSNNTELTKYFDSIERELKRDFNETLIVGRTKTKTVIYISTVKYNIKWATNTMHKFISVIDNKLELFYGNNKNNIDYEKNNNFQKINSENNSIQDQSDINDLEEINEDDIFEEQEYVHLNIIDGQSSVVKLTRYERNPKNRAEAIKIHGTTCLACGFNFNDFYGEELAKDFIEVHHIKPVSQGEYTVNPKTDLVPLCSNCHSMIHKEKNPPKTIEEIRNRYKRF